jgi:hypothetical protein
MLHHALFPQLGRLPRISSVHTSLVETRAIFPALWVGNFCAEPVLLINYKRTRFAKTIIRASRHSPYLVLLGPRTKRSVENFERPLRKVLDLRSSSPSKRVRMERLRIEVQGSSVSFEGTVTLLASVPS